MDKSLPDMKWTLQIRAFWMVLSLQSVRLMACNHKLLRSASKGVFVDGILWKWMSFDWPCLFLHPTAQQDIFFFILGVSPVFPRSLYLFPLLFWRCHNARATAMMSIWYPTKKKFCLQFRRKKQSECWNSIYGTKRTKIDGQSPHVDFYYPSTPSLFPESFCYLYIC